MRRRRITRSGGPAHQIRNGHRALAVRTSDLLPGHLWRNLKRSAANGAAQLRGKSLRGELLRGITWRLEALSIVRRITRRQICGWRKTSRRIVWRRGGLFRISSRWEPKELGRRQHHHSLAERAADLLPGIGWVNLDCAPAERALHRHGVHEAERAKREPR